MRRFCAMTLAILMILSLVPMSVFAWTVDNSTTVSNFTVIDNDKSTLAPGVTLEEIVMYNSRNQRVEMYVTTVDTTVDTVQVKANYLNNQNKVFGMQTLSEQVAAMEKNYPEPFKIVAGINASYYNTTTGQPTGAFVMEGVDASASGDSYAFFAVLKDGTYMIGAKGEYSKYKNQLQEAIGGYQHIVHNGVVTAGLDKTTLYPRQTLGLTADGKLILMTADGSQVSTVGTTIQEQAEIMLSLGCVEAIHLDGGNSATFGIIPEGEDKFVTKNSPSGGAERAVSNTLMIISTAVADGTFDHAVINSDYNYLAPYSTYTFTAFGVDATNAAATIPENAVWVLSDDVFGTVSNGTFVSNGKLGTVDVQLTVGGKVVGSKTVTIANPTSAAFALEETTVPYGKTASIAVTALKEQYAIYTDATHYNFAINSAAAGAMNGFQFTANNDESVESAVVTATYKYAEGVFDKITVKFGKGSEVLFDFEDGDISDWKGTKEYAEWREEYNSNNPPYPLYDPHDYSNSIDKQYSEVFLATEENGGHVKNGEYALGFRMNHRNVTDVGGWLYNYLYYTGDTKVFRDVANGQNAIRIGFWLYSPNLTNVAFRLVRGTSTDGKTGIKYSYMISDYDGKNVSYATNYGIPESGWIYVYYDLTDFADNVVQSTSISGATQNGTKANADYFPAFLQLFTGSAFDSMEDMVFYIDDITLDYSDVTEDRDAPVISNAEVCFDTANFVAMNGQKVNSNLLSFSAKVSDASDNSNMAGLNYAAAKIYIDGVDVSRKSGFKASNGYISLNDVYLTNGKHSVAFVIFDNQGNETRLTKTITVEGSATNSVVSVVGRNEGDNLPKAGSVYFIDIKASDAAQISKIVTTLRVNTSHTIEHNNIVCADGVEATVAYDAKGYTATIALTHDGSLDGDAVLASIPVRVWAWDEEATGVTAEKQFATGAIPTIDIEYKTLYGEVVYAGNAYESYVAGFYGEGDVKTELDNKTAWHKHNAVAMTDLAATCTKDGYTGRTYCAGCSSVVDWGTDIEATGHSYEFSNNKLVCACGKQYTSNGLVEMNGNAYYILGGSLISGWNYVDTKDEKTTGYYYFSTVDYAAVDGAQTIDGYSYQFEDKLLVRGTLQKTDAMICYMWAGQWVMNSWATIDGEKYYFTSNGAAKIGPGTIRGENGVFAFSEDGIWLEGRNGLMTVYGRTYYYVDGMCKAAGLVEVDGDYYYINANYQPVTGKCWVGKPNTAVTGYAEGEYEFDADGKMIGKLIKNGPVGDYFYVDDVLQKAFQLVEYDGYYYFINSGNKIAKNCTIYLTAEFASEFELPVGYYGFDSEGRLIVRNGPVGDYFYLNNVKQTAYRFVEFEGNYYFINDANKLAKNCKIYLGEQFTAKFGLPSGYYTFDADGKVVFRNGIIGDYYYVNDKLQMAYQLIEYQGDYYFINDGSKIAKNCKIYLGEQFTAKFDLPAGYYTFDADGKAVFRNGIIGDYYYVNDKLQMAYQLIEYQGDYYFINDGSKIAKNCKIYLGEQFTAKFALAAGYYSFDADGKMELRNGIVGDYYYVNNVLQKAYQLIKIGEDYYFINDGNRLAKDCTIYLGEQFTEKFALTAGYYSFDADGKMVVRNGIVGNYFYINNKLQTAYRLVEWEGNYYFIGDGNKIVKNGKVYLLESFLHKYGLPADTYSFDAEGKMILKNGPVGGRFYIDGILQNPYQLVKYDGYYYFVNDGGYIAKGCTVYLSKEFVYAAALPVGYYSFDSNGRMIIE